MSMHLPLRRAAAVLAVLLVAAILTIAARDQRASRESTPAPGPREALAESSSAPTPPSIDANAESSAAAQASPAPLHSGFADLPNSRIGLPLEDDPFGARSVLDQQWLDRNGYPNALQWRAYTAASPDALRQAAEAGDSRAAIYLDNWRLIQGEAGALDALLEHARSGSLYALELAASAHVGSRVADPTMAYVLYRVLELRGNHAAGMAREMTVGAALTALERLEAEGLALELYADLFGDRHLQPCAADPRPLPPQAAAPAP